MFILIKTGPASDSEISVGLIKKSYRSSVFFLLIHLWRTIRLNKYRSTLNFQSINDGPHDFFLFNLSKKKHDSCLFVEKTVLTIFLFFFSCSRTKKIKILTENHKEGVFWEKNIKISSRLEPIKPQCSAGPGYKSFYWCVVVFKNFTNFEETFIHYLVFLRYSVYTLVMT